MILPPLMIKPSISSVPGLKDELNVLNLTIDNIKKSMVSTPTQSQVLAKVATSGDYNDLIGKPIVPIISYPVTSVAGRIGDIILSSRDIGGLAPVATSNSYNDLLNKPVMPTISYPVTTVSGRKGDVVISTSDVSGLALVAKTNDYNDLLNKPSNSSVRRVETYLGNTDSSGNYTVVYSTPFTKVPDVQPQLQTGNFNQFVKITSSTITGFTVSVGARASVTIAGLEVLLSATTVVNGASIGVLVTQRI